MRVLLLVTLVGAMVSPAHGVAQSPSDRRRSIDSLAALLRSRYISADTGALIADHLIARARAGAYDSATESRAFENLVTEDMRAVNGDKHLSLRQRPAGGAAGGLPFAPPADLGFSRVEVMDGNIGYLRLSIIASPTPDALSVLARAMDSLRRVDALIIDVRDNPGGNGLMNNYLWGYIVGPDSVRTMLALPRGASTPAVRWSTPIDKPRPRSGIPIFILTSSHTGSAAEGFSFFLQQSGRARTVGETTAGAGHNVAFLPVDPTLTASISIGRVMYAGNRREWERVGVAADMPAAADSALVVALRAARQRLGR